MLLSGSCEDKQPCNLAFGYRSVLLDVVNEFLFGGAFVAHRALNDKQFSSPLAHATYTNMEWIIWAIRNFYFVDVALTSLPLWFWRCSGLSSASAADLIWNVSH